MNLDGEEAARLLLMYAVFPVWVAAGLADWACHRRTRIERTSGLPENIFHWGLFALMGLATLAVGLLEVNAAILLLVFAAFLAHELATYLELRYTVPLRPIGPFEQMVHSFMELLPLVALALLATLAGTGGGAVRAGRAGLQPAREGAAPAARLPAGGTGRGRAVQRAAAGRRDAALLARAPGLIRRRTRARPDPDERLQVDHVARLEAGLAVEVAPQHRRESQQVWYSGQLGLLW
ncbi:hypothetical protein HK414_02120 [Ramlibacter terrae]|uniref:Diguanylate cyclase n=1 Tax=Ramlibacter terrae TaxID=2732511 RepID=A0ABX6P348_9BURK|nr:hypothetical protein HK414_02120 [Ramlibacter terrae]